MPTVTALRIAPVKGLRVQEVDAIELDAAGARGDRAFHLRTPSGRVALSTRHASLRQVAAAVDGERLALTFPDGSRVEAVVELAEPVRTRLYDGRAIGGRVVRGPFAAALGEHLGREVQLVARDPHERAGDDAAASLLARPSVADLARAVGAAVDERRFRMTLTIDGTQPWEEHGWTGRDLRAGDAILRVVAPCVRCAVITHDPESGVADPGVLKTLGRVREDVALGLLLEIIRPGTVRVGDGVRPVTPD